MISSFHTGYHVSRRTTLALAWWAFPECWRTERVAKHANGQIYSGITFAVCILLGNVPLLMDRWQTYVHFSSITSMTSRTVFLLNPQQSVEDGKKRKSRQMESCAGSDCDRTAPISRFTASFEPSHPFVITSHSLGLLACSHQPVKPLTNVGCGLVSSKRTSNDSC